jgi:hypothetical protein
MGVRTRGSTSGERQARRVAGHWPVRRGQVVVILRPGAEGLPRRLHGSLRARAADLNLAHGDGRFARLFRMLVRIPAAVVITISVMSSRRPSTKTA